MSDPHSATEAPPTTAGTCPFLHQGYEPFEQQDPFPSYAGLRTEEPVFFDERTNYWVVSRYEDIKKVFADWETFSSENAQKPVRPRGPQATSIMAEGGFTAYSGLSARVPPDHTRIRKAVGAGFTPRRYAELEPAIRDYVVTIIDELLQTPGDEADLVAAIANTIPVATILTLLGVDTDYQVESFKRWSTSRAAMTWGDLDDEQQIPHAMNLVEYWQVCQDLVREAHETLPDTLIGDLVRAQNDGDEITDHEIASACYSLLFAGHETTTTLISNAFRLLLEDRAQWERVIEEPKLIAGAIEEVLRYSPSIVAWRRKATRPGQIDGHDIAEGDEVLLLMGSANRDPEHFENPETFDIERPNAREHLAFGYGIHFCLGNKLAKLQTRVLIEEMAARVPQLRLVDARAIEFPNSLSMRAPVDVPVRW